MQVTKLDLRIGPYQLHAIPTGEFGLDGGAMFGTVPKVLWEKTNPADEQNRIQMEARALLIVSPDRKILVDTGVGSDFVAKYGEKLGESFAQMYAVDESKASLEKSLARFNLTPADITDVILTHLHFDHAGGATAAKDGRLVPRFPKARYYVQRRNLETASDPNLRERASYFAANYQPLLDAGVLNLLDGPQQDVLPNISVMITDGHTQGQQVVKISDGAQTLVYCADLVPTSTHVRLPWIMGYDLNPLLLIDEKKQILGQAADQGWVLFFEHDPYCDGARIMRKEHDFRLSEKVNLS